MDEFWKALQSSEELRPGELAARFAAAFVLGLCCAVLHHFATRWPTRPANRPFLATLVLFSVLVAMIMSIIGNSQARAFSLVGTLSLVRFRNVVEDSRDSAFVILAVGLGMAAGFGFIFAALAALPLVALTAWIFRAPLTERTRNGTVVVRLAATHPPGPALAGVLESHVGPARLVALETVRGGAAMDARYAIELPPAEAILALVAEVCKLEGVQAVELKES